MKKILVLALVVIMSVVCLAGCGKFECDLCGEEKSGEEHTTKILGEEVTICDDCYNGKF